MKLCVIGGGVAGCMAAIQAAGGGAEVVLYEKNEKLLKKMFITGKGRCNLTNFADVNNFLQGVVNNGRFLYSSLSAFDSFETYRFFEETLRVPLKVERGNRVFPASDKSGDVTRALEGCVRSCGAAVRLCTRVSALAAAGGGWQVKTSGESAFFDRVIITTGGLSYPQTGSTGDGYSLADRLGHTVVQPVPSLVGVNCAESFLPRLAGLTLKNTGLKCMRGDKLVYEDFGELLFTHSGVSGPMVLSLSSRINRSALADTVILLDLKPSLSERELDERVQRDFASNGNRAYKNALNDLLPKSIIPVLVACSGVDPDKPVRSLSSAERGKLVALLKAFRLTVVSLRDIAEAVVTSGGVSVKEVNPKTMESKKASGIYFAGEVLDVDAETGGYNIQIALSTGYAAGVHASVS